MKAILPLNIEAHECVSQMNFLNCKEEQRVTLEKSDLIQLVNYCLQKGAEPKAQVPEHFNIKQLARYLNYSEPAIYKMVAHSEIPSYKLSGKILFKKSEVHSWLFEFRQPTIKSQIAELENRGK